MKPQNDLGPCPFCKSSNVGLESTYFGNSNDPDNPAPLYWFSVEGDECCARGPIRETKAEAIEGWRAAPQEANKAIK